MSISRQSSRLEKPSTYIWQDRLTEEELGKLQVQDQLITASMGGVLPEQPDARVFRRVLDVGSGTGDWLLEVAQTYPMITRLDGIDISILLVEFARAQAEAHQMSDRVQFQKMDALGFLNFPRDSFDLINLRFGSNFVRTWEWNHLLHEFKRISQPGGVIRITEADGVESSSPSIKRGEDLVQQALYQSGHTFASQREGFTRELTSLLHQAGLQNIQTHVHTFNYQDGGVGQRLLFKYLDHGFQMLQPFLQKWMGKPDDLEDLLQQRKREMQQPDLVASVNIHTVWGTKP